MFFQKVLVLNPYPQTPFPRERLCMLGWLCIVQSLWAYTPGIRAGAECGAAALTPLGATPQTPFSKIYRFIDRLSCCRLSDAGFRKITLLLTAYLLL